MLTNSVLLLQLKVEDKEGGQIEDKKSEDQHPEKSPENQVSERNGRYQVSERNGRYDNGGYMDGEQYSGDDLFLK